MWLECNGQSFDTESYPQLYKTLGRSTVPDLNGRFLLGSSSVGSTGGRSSVSVTLSKDNMPKHTHTRGTMNITGGVNAIATTGGAAQNSSKPLNTWGAFIQYNYKHAEVASNDELSLRYYHGFQFDASKTWTGETSEEGGSAPFSFNITNPYITVKWMIKAK